MLPCCHAGWTEYPANSVQKVAENIDDIEEFGDLPAPLLNRLSQILSKRRVLTPGALNLFLRPDLQSIDLYDCASTSQIPLYIRLQRG